MLPKFLLIVIVLLINSEICSSQKVFENDSIDVNNTGDFSVSGIPEKFIKKVDQKVSSIKDKVTRQTEKYLSKLQREEERLQQGLQKIDSSVLAKFSNAKEKYQKLSQSIKSKTAFINKFTGGQYNSCLDTLSTSFGFLKQFSSLTDRVKKPLKDLEELQSKLQQTEKIWEFIAQRKEQIKQLLSKYTSIPAGLRKEYEKLSKTAYYYSAQIKEYKEILKDPKKIEQRSLSLLNKLPAFQKFMKENGQLASLFGISSANTDPSVVLAGLQTRASVQALIQQQISIGGPNAQAAIQQNLAQAHAELDKLKDKINQLGGGSGELEMPDFKPNSQKTKSFLKRLEIGSNLQFSKNNNLLPKTADVALSIGYKLNDKSIIGIGTSYKMGIGSIQHFSITHQGIGFRSFVDYKVKSQFFITGGYEMNYNAQFKNIDQLKDLNSWQQSGLIGLSKKYKVSKKIKGNAQLLYDFLANKHIPVSQPILFRVGYIIK